MSITAFFFVFVAYARYPLVSSDYWEEQAGPREMIGFFIDKANQYDEFQLVGDRPYGLLSERKRLLPGSIRGQLVTQCIAQRRSWN